MEEQKSPNEPDLTNVEEINNLDTARMTLRWALERLHSLERFQKETSEKLNAERKLREKTEAETARLQSVLSLKERDSTDRDLYYSKLEEYLSQALAGKLDVVALAKREHETSELKKFLEERQARLDKEHAHRLEALERQYRTLRVETESNAMTHARQAEEALARQKQSLERSYLAKMEELNEKEVRLKAFDNELSERQAKFEKFYAGQKAQVEKEINLLNQSLEDQTQFRLASAEKFLAIRHESLEEVWRKEKQVLFSELQEWRHRSEESLPRLLDLEKKLAESQESEKQVRLALDREAMRYEKERFHLQDEQEKLLRAMAQWKQKLSQATNRVLELEPAAAAAQEAAQRAKSALNEERKRRGALDEKNEKIYQDRVDVLEADYQRAWHLLKTKEADLADLDRVLSTRFKDLDEQIHLQDVEWKTREEWLRRRDVDWHVKLADWERDLAEKAKHLEDLKNQLLEAVRAYKLKAEKPQGQNKTTD